MEKFIALVQHFSYVACHPGLIVCSDFDFACGEPCVIYHLADSHQRAFVREELQEVPEDVVFLRFMSFVFSSLLFKTKVFSLAYDLVFIFTYIFFYYIISSRYSEQ